MGEQVMSPCGNDPARLSEYEDARRRITAAAEAALMDLQDAAWQAGYEAGCKADAMLKARNVGK